MQAVAVKAARAVFLERSGIAVSLMHRRAVQDDVRDALRGRWHIVRDYAADVAVFGDLAHFRTAWLDHRLRIEAGASIYRRDGEELILLTFPAAIAGRPGLIEELSKEFDHTYRKDAYGGDLQQEGHYALFADDREGTDVGFVLGLSYGVSISNAVVGVYADLHGFQGNRSFSYGLHVGAQY